MAGIILARCLLLVACVSYALGSHFRGGIIMVRPMPSGGLNEVRIHVYIKFYIKCKYSLIHWNRCCNTATSEQRIRSIVIHYTARRNLLNDIRHIMRCSTTNLLYLALCGQNRATVWNVVLTTQENSPFCVPCMEPGFPSAKESNCTLVSCSFNIEKIGNFFLILENAFISSSTC